MYSKIKWEEKFKVVSEFTYVFCMEGIVALSLQSCLENMSSDRFNLPFCKLGGCRLPCWLRGEESTCSAGNTGSICLGGGGGVIISLVLSRCSKNLK